MFCLNDNFVKLKQLKESKLCSEINCERDWRNNQRKRIFELNECVESCNENYPYEYENKCYQNCPDEALSENKCKNLFEPQIEEEKEKEKEQEKEKEKGKEREKEKEQEKEKERRKKKDKNKKRKKRRRKK